MEYLICAIVVAVPSILISFLIGALVGTDRMRKAIEERSIGNLRIDRSEANEPPKPFLEIVKGTSIESIAQESFVILKVINKNYISCD